ncbi:MAG: enoyl-CoA hydratase/isomerase family protein [Longimicrobiales bacterium]|nr:enoyl-CoA hydratase/isomerase family protein [Longimicrobiales bacterium]
MSERPRDPGPGVSTEQGRLPVIVERDGAIATITLNRPEKLNALNQEVRRMVMRIVDELQADDAIRVAILQGAGDRAFVAGADVSEFAARTPAEQRALYQERRVYDALADFEKPLICAIHGYCLGGGSELALACDLRVADRTARFGQAEIRLGLIPGAGGTQRLARLVGPGHAMRIALTGEMIDAEEAHRIGLVEVLVDEGEHRAKARELADQMARWSPVALRLAKASVRKAFEAPLSEGLTFEKEAFLQAFESADGREGVRAFVEKREPRFTGE